MVCSKFWVFPVSEVRFVAIYAPFFFGNFGQKGDLFGRKQCFLGKKCTLRWYVLHIILK